MVCSMCYNNMYCTVVQVAKPATAARALTSTSGSQSLFSGAHIRGDGRFFFSAATALKKRKTAENKKAYELFRQLQDNVGAPEGLEFTWRFGNADANFPNWGGCLTEIPKIRVWFDKCQASLAALDPELLSPNCTKELETWNTEFLELQEDLTSWTKRNQAQKTGTPATKSKVQLVFYSSALFSFLQSGTCTMIEC